MIDTYLEQVASNGLLGVLLVLSLITIYVLYRELSNERKDRLNEMRELLKEDLAFRKEIKTTIDRILDLVTRNSK